jgi:hypothetical protein
MFPLQAAISFMQFTLLATALKMGSTNSTETSANLHIGTALYLSRTESSLHFRLWIMGVHIKSFPNEI